MVTKRGEHRQRVKSHIMLSMAFLPSGDIELQFVQLFIFQTNKRGEKVKMKVRTRNVLKVLSDRHKSISFFLLFYLR